MRLVTLLRFNMRENACAWHGKALQAIGGTVAEQQTKPHMKHTRISPPLYTVNVYSILCHFFILILGSVVRNMVKGSYKATDTLVRHYISIRNSPLLIHRFHVYTYTLILKIPLISCFSHV